jgi:hypothetical protein
MGETLCANSLTVSGMMRTCGAWMAQTKNCPAFECRRQSGTNRPTDLRSAQVGFADMARGQCGYRRPRLN